MSAPSLFAIGSVVTVVAWDKPVAIHNVAKVGARVTLGDGSVWHKGRHSHRWCPYGESKYQFGSYIRATESGDAAIVKALIEARNAERERDRLARRIADVSRRSVDVLPTSAMREIVAIFDAHGVAS